MNDASVLHQIINIPDYYIGGIGSGIKCTTMVIYHLHYKKGNLLPVHMYFTEDANETVLLPTDIVTTHEGTFDSWLQD